VFAVFRASETKRTSWLQHGGKLKKIEAKLFLTIANLSASATLRIDTHAHAHTHGQAHTPAGTNDAGNTVISDESHTNSMAVVVTPELAVRELMVTAKVMQIYKYFLFFILSSQLFIQLKQYRKCIKKYILKQKRKIQHKFRAIE
jgi:hypothetical protein